MHYPVWSTKKTKLEDNTSVAIRHKRVTSCHENWHHSYWFEMLNHQEWFQSFSLMSLASCSFCRLGKGWNGKQIESCFKLTKHFNVNSFWNFGCHMTKSLCKWFEHTCAVSIRFPYRITSEVVDKSKFETNAIEVLKFFWRDFRTKIFISPSQMYAKIPHEGNSKSNARNSF